MPNSAKQVRGRARQSAWIAARVDVLLTFRQKFPAAFSRLSHRQRQPLKIGIHHDIAAALPELGPVKISCALHHYVSDPAYHRAVIEGAPRIDLDGNPAGAVTASEAANSQRAIAAFETRLAQRRKQSAPAAPAIEKTKPLSLAGLKAAAAARKLATQET